jgi:UDP-N-acetyl-D-mannosaminuronate dehydrogenase
VLVIGLAYKPDVDDVRETPAAEIIKLLLEHGARSATTTRTCRCSPACASIASTACTRCRSARRT